MNKKKKVCVFLGSRSNYGSLKSVMKELRKARDFELLTVVGASALLDRFGMAVKVIEQDGFKITTKIHMILEGETPVTMAKSTGLCIIETATVLNNLQPDIVLVAGDRFEILGIATTAAYMNIPVAHTMGGEVSGSIDESVRHVVTKLAHIHFPATKLSAQRILMMGEPKEHVHVVGCPRIDEVRDVLEKNNDAKYLCEQIFKKGVGAKFDLSKPFLLILQHPVTTEYSQGIEHIQVTLDVVDRMGINTIMLWPNVDAGSEDISRGIRLFRERSRLIHFHLFKNFPVEVFTSLMNHCACMIGNSSAAIREGAYIGVPAVNIGTRQQGRERGKNVIDVGYSKDEIYNAIKKQLQHGKFERHPIYGDGFAGKKIVEILRQESVKVQKKFVDHPEFFSKPRRRSTK